MSGFTQYLKDTRAELRHVAWPTRTQTIVYTILVTAISVGVAAYLGFFDFIFTTALTNTVNTLPAQNPVTVTQPAAVTATSSGNAIKGPTFTITPSVSTSSGK